MTIDAAHFYAQLISYGMIALGTIVLLTLSVYFIIELMKGKK